MISHNVYHNIPLLCGIAQQPGSLVVLKVTDVQLEICVGGDQCRFHLREAGTGTLLEGNRRSDQCAAYDGS